MTGDRIGLRNTMWLAVVAAINLAMFRGVMNLLLIPAIAVFLVLLDVVLVRVLIWRRPLRPFDYGFIACGFTAAMVSLSPGVQDFLLPAIRRLHEELFHILSFYGLGWFGYFSYFTLHRVVVCALILSVALAGGFAAKALNQRRLNRFERADRPPLQDA
ncbi:hypothetical protein EP7_005340 [Isosphaeraceae bacterium EP7]